MKREMLGVAKCGLRSTHARTPLVHVHHYHKRIGWGFVVYSCPSIHFSTNKEGPLRSQCRRHFPSRGRLEILSESVRRPQMKRPRLMPFSRVIPDRCFAVACRSGCEHSAPSSLMVALGLLLLTPPPH